MKIQALLLLLLLLLNQVRCSKEEAVPLASKGTMIAKVDSKDWKSLIPQAIFANGTLFVGALGKDGTLIKIFVSEVSVGGHEIAGTIAGIAPENYVVHEDATSIFLAEDQVGQVHITEIDELAKTISGTFASKVKKAHYAEGRIIELGSFTKIPFTTSATSPGSPISIGAAKIDGVDFVATYTWGRLGPEEVLHFINLFLSDGTRSVSLYMTTGIGPGTYEFNTSADFGASYVFASDIHTGVLLANNNATSGNLVISVHNTALRRIEGSFEFVAEPIFGVGVTYQITQGVFAVTYP